MFSIIPAPGCCKNASGFQDYHWAPVASSQILYVYILFLELGTGKKYVFLHSCGWLLPKHYVFKYFRAWLLQQHRVSHYARAWRLPKHYGSYRSRNRFDPKTLRFQLFPRQTAVKQQLHRGIPQGAGCHLSFLLCFLVFFAAGSSKKVRWLTARAWRLPKH
jgi:hypothetical protein